ncbi:transposase [uncultured Bacteroides sp.]|uniref:IS66 family transposase n=1 Tax=uncultured Bacteroides sp. TaxID=162156 RepID=UPI0025F30C51|nr:transposase [uncultured Bacteroides sp.]
MPSGREIGGFMVLTDFIGDAALSALQSDAYNVYKYLDGALSEVEHICCMAHVRAKIPKVLLQGKDEQARSFMEWLGKLYDLERGYIKDHLPPDEIKRLRNGLETTEIIGSIWMELTRLLAAPLPKSDLLTTALHYLKNAWTPVMAYRHDDRYCIDNSIAKRSICPLMIERKCAETSTVYHTFTPTCRMGALSFYQFLKKYFTAFMEGRTDFENLTFAILGNKLRESKKY